MDAETLVCSLTRVKTKSTRRSVRKMHEASSSTAVTVHEFNYYDQCYRQHHPLHKPFNQEDTGLPTRRTALKQSEASLAEAQRLARLGGWEWDLGTDEISWSDEIFRICGLAPQAGVPSLEKTWELVHPKDREIVSGAIEEAIYGDTPYDIEFRVVRPDGGPGGCTGGPRWCGGERVASR